MTIFYHHSISGLITGLIGTGGAPRATFLIGFNLERTKYIAIAAVIALGTDATRIPNNTERYPDYCKQVDIIEKSDNGNMIKTKEFWNTLQIAVIKN